MFAGEMARFRLHRVELPFGLDERRMHFLLWAKAADFILVVNDVAAPFGDLQVGWRVMVTGNPGPDGTIQAQTVNALGNAAR